MERIIEKVIEADQARRAHRGAEAYYEEGRRAQEGVMYKFLFYPSSMVEVTAADCIQLTGETPVDLDAAAEVDGVVIDDIASVFGGGRLYIIYNLVDRTIKALRDTERIKYMTTEPRSLIPAVAQERASLLDTICDGNSRPTYRELLAALS